MKIDLLEYLGNKIGDTSWHGETCRDDISEINMETLDCVLTDIEYIRDYLLTKLYEHEYYRKGNASAERLHKLAMSILEKHGEKMEN